MGEEASEESACANARIEEMTAMKRKGIPARRTVMGLVCSNEGRPGYFEKEG